MRWMLVLLGLGLVVWGVWVLGAPSEGGGRAVQTRRSVPVARSAPSPAPAAPDSPSARPAASADSPSPREAAVFEALRPGRAALPEWLTVTLDVPVPFRRLRTRADLDALDRERSALLDGLHLDLAGPNARALPLDTLLAALRGAGGIPSVRSDGHDAPVVLDGLRPGRWNARELLDLFAERHALAWSMRWATLLIHAPGTQPPRPDQLRIYAAGDLAVSGPDGLLDEVRADVAPWSWTAFDGATQLKDAGAGTLIAHTLPPVHDDLDVHLELRRRAAAADAPVPMPTEEEWNGAAVSGAERSR